MIQQNQISPTTQKSQLSQKDKFHLPLFFPEKFPQLPQKIPEQDKIDDYQNSNFIPYLKKRSC